MDYFSIGLNDMSMFWKDLLSICFPGYCLVCDTVLIKGEEFICLHCYHTLPVTNYHLDPNNLMMQHLYNRCPLVHAMAYYSFKVGGSVQKIIHQLKYNNWPVLGQILGKRYGRLLKRELDKAPFDYIVPIPLHPRKQRKRGYNQSSLFAQGLAQALSIPWEEHAVVRTKNTASQTQQDRLARFDNVADAFVVSNDLAIANKHVLLVDDVATTGSTLEACAKTLQEAGVRAISVATIAFALSEV